LSDSPDIPDFLLQAIIELENEIAAQISDFEPLLNRQYPLLLKQCRRATRDQTRDQNEARGIVHNVFCKFFELVRKDIVALELRKFKSLEAWLKRAAENAIVDFRREQSLREHGERPKRIEGDFTSPTPKFGYRYAHELPKIKDEDGLCLDVIDCASESTFVSARRNPEERVFDREILTRYRSALRQLTPLQRAVYILCKDDLLPAGQQEQLLSLDARTARMVVETMRARPRLRLVDLANLLGRKEGTLSSELTRAKRKLQAELSDLRWRKPSELAIPKWPRELLVGFSGHRGFLRSFGGQVAEPGEPVEISERDEDFVRAMPGGNRQHESIRPLKQASLCARWCQDGCKPPSRTTRNMWNCWK
jgi:RNA polymerase sigma factor (sigma-70 family)